MSELLTYFQIAWRHVLDVNSYFHVLFLVALLTPYSFKDWKRILLVVTFLIVGQIVALTLSFFGIINSTSKFIFILIPITILITALFNLFTSGKSYKGNGINWIGFFVLFFGITHGLAYSNYFKTALAGNVSHKIIPFIEFTLGIQVTQLIIILLFLIVSYSVQNFFRFSKRDVTLVCSSFAIGVVLPVIMKQIL